MTFTAAVSPGAATGTVDFKDGGVTITGGGNRPISGGSASFSTSSLTNGDHSITAVYSGDSNYYGSTSSPLIQTVNPLSAPVVIITISCNGQPPPTYTLTYTAGANGTISGTSPQTVNSGGSGTSVTAVPDTGYHFVNWSDSITANPRTDTNVTSDISVTANFVINGIDHYSVSSVSSQTAGTAFNMSIQAQDANNNNITTGSETINITSGLTDTGKSPTSAATTNGAATISMTMTVAQGGQSLTFTGATSGESGTSNSFTVNPAAAATLIVSGYPSPAIVDEQHSFTVEARDTYDNTGCRLHRDRPFHQQ